ncbi:MAG: hypothetical protein QXH80_04265 [Candidatus Nanoarchaeia archaeon]
MPKTSLEKIIEEEVARFREQIKLVEDGRANRYSLVFSENLLAYILQKMKPSMLDEDVQYTASLLLDYFGQDGFVIDNRLDKDFYDKDIRQALHQAEDIGLLRTEREEEVVLVFTKRKKKKTRKGFKTIEDEAHKRPWRLHYWLWNYHNIFEAMKDKKEEPADEFSIYRCLPDEVWTGGKS